MAYDKEDLKELRRLQSYFKRQIASDCWDSIAERLGDTYIDIIAMVNTASTPDDINYLAFRSAYYVKDRISDLRKKNKSSLLMAA